VIPLESILQLIKTLADEAIKGIIAGGDGQRDAFAFGAINGQLRVLGELDARLNALIEQANSSEDE
jgi:hypothetical protein